ncbi:hypothetical protein CNR22_15380 [Sphingobacteriaceae bacterium]|nr:hypothetical protein CNR22_15380 [Sphingobacteriaceae bacterium]
MASGKDALWYHEDDYCMIELTPKENIKALNDESEIINAKSKENFDGYGFTDIHVISDEKIGLDIRQISPVTLDEIVNKTGIQKASSVATGYSTHREGRKNTFGFGAGYAAIYYSVKGGTVDRIWFTNLSSLDKEKVIPCLNEIGEKWNLVLMDWFQTKVVELSDRNEIEIYLKGPDEN